ncbi:hypothetical protein MBANPS3_012567, partial [Mucor bainieri]
NNGLKHVSPFTVLSSFHGAFFFPIDEMHMWGQGIGKQLWALATNDSAKYGITNPLWLDTNSRKSLRDHMESLVKTTDVYALSNEFFNKYKKAPAPISSTIMPEHHAVFRHGHFSWICQGSGFH